MNLNEKLIILEKKNENLLRENERLKNDNLKFKRKKMPDKIYKYNDNQEKLENGELMTVIFFSIDQNVTFPIICKSSDNFKNIENELYEKYPEYKKKENEKNYFCNGSKINKDISLEENNISNGNIIILFKK